MRSPFVDEHLGELWVIHGDGDPDLPPPGAFPAVVVAVGTEFGAIGPPAADAVFGADDLDDVIARIGRSPLASCALAILLRHQATRDVEHGLADESAVYSVLQAGPEFAKWRREHPPRLIEQERSTVAVTRDESTLHVTLQRPHRHNAISAQMRDELTGALSIAVADPSIRHVMFTGTGPSFCTGGDLDEFGRRPDPATAHVTRLARSPARLVNLLAERVEVQIHGYALGGGIEIAAFASTVVAHGASQVGLPEIELGLIPGAGGTVSVTRRIGRQRTAALALSGRRIDAPMALQWGLVDRLVD